MNDFLLDNQQFIDLYNYLTSEEVFGLSSTSRIIQCDHTLRYTVGWMKKYHIQDVQTNIEKIMDVGGHCDCEVLMNVDPNTWVARKEESITGPDMMGEQEWMQFISDVLDESGYSDSEKM